MADQNKINTNFLDKQFEVPQGEAPKLENEARPEDHLNLPSLEKSESNIIQPEEGTASFELKSSGGQGVTAQTQAKKEEVLRIEKILEDGLNDLVINMPRAQQHDFIAHGERAANEIDALLHETKIKFFKIIDIIIKWLQLLPGANKYFIENEAKIKANRIIREKRSA